MNAQQHIRCCCFIVLLLLLLTTSTHTHLYYLNRNNKCLRQQQQPIQIDKLIGEWFVLESSNNNNKYDCLLFDINKDNQTNKYYINEFSESINQGIFRTTKTEIKYQNINQVNDDNNGTVSSLQMIESPFVVLSTDYQQYLLVYSCYKLTFYYDESISILSRQLLTNGLDDLPINIKRIIDEKLSQVFGIDYRLMIANKLTRINHLNCNDRQSTTTQTTDMTDTTTLHSLFNYDDEFW